VAAKKGGTAGQKPVPLWAGFFVTGRRQGVNVEQMGRHFASPLEVQTATRHGASGRVVVLPVAPVAGRVLLPADLLPGLIL
jgi:hypothetical protein